jgi:cytochrome c oxidase accessory protein FixG
MDSSSSPPAKGLPVSGDGCCGKCENGKNGTCEKQASESPTVLSSRASASEQPQDETMLAAPEHVLSTLESDGSRRWLYPLLAKGKLWKRRRVVGFVLAAIFILLPHLSIGGKPPILLDVAAREFTFLGTTFLPTDTLLLATGMLLVFFSIVLATALGGRLWCGWGCPQTVYMEFLFRPIDRFFEGTTGKGGKPKREVTGALRVARWLVYLIVCMFLAHTFLAYFVGIEALSRWIQTPPWEHPTAFLVMAVTTGLMLYHFLFFREQLCLIACPYGRFQSVMLDRKSMIVAYDYNRGEPRKKGRRDPLPIADQHIVVDRSADQQKNNVADQTKTIGDCVDCNRCVAVCPTGIDIRQGLQLECVNCTQCIDACDDVMDKVGLPKGLIRYDSQDGIDGKGQGLLRARTVIYPMILLVVGGLFLYVLGGKYAFDAQMTRAPGNPFTRIGSTEVRNTLRLRLVNRSGVDQVYSIKAIEPASVKLEVLDPAGLELKVGETSTVPIVVDFNARVTSQSGHVDAVLEISDQSGNTQTQTYRLLGPLR